MRGVRYVLENLKRSNWPDLYFFVNLASVAETLTPFETDERWSPFRAKRTILQTIQCTVSLADILLYSPQRDRASIDSENNPRSQEACCFTLKYRLAQLPGKSKRRSFRYIR